MRSLAVFTLVAVAVLAVPPATADDVTDVERMVCAPMVVHECRTDVDCFSGPPWDFDIGPFFDVDLEKRRIASTERDRATDLKNIERDGELVILQAYETGRALSMVISQSSGFFTATITLDDGALTVFGACKKHEGGK